VACAGNGVEAAYGATEPWAQGATQPRRAGGTAATQGQVLAAGFAAILLVAAGAAAWGGQLLVWFPSYQPQLPNLANFLGLWLSPAWGLLPYAPVLWVSAVGAWSFLRRYPAAAFLALGGALFYMLQASALRFWWGYWGYGPRQLLPLIPLLLLPLPAGWAWVRTHWRRGGTGLILASAAAGALVQGVGVMVPFSAYVYEVLMPQGITGPDLTWNLRLWPVLGILRFGRLVNLDVAWVRERNSGSPQIAWAVLIPLLALALLALAWLVFLALRQERAGRAAGWITSLAIVTWVPTSLLLLQNVYLDERYRSETGYRAAAELIQSERCPNDIVITDLWTPHLTDPALALLNYCHGRCPARLDLVREDLTECGGDWTTRLEQQLVGYRRVWLLLDSVPEGDPNSIVEQWLNDTGYLERCDWTGPEVRLCRYFLDGGCPLLSISTPVALASQLELQTADVRVNREPDCNSPAVKAGDALLIDLQWRALAQMGTDYVASMQLLAPDGRAVEVMDRRPTNGFQPTSSWTVGQEVRDRYALEVPGDAQSGIYTLNVVVYNPQDMRRLVAHQPDVSTSDAVTLGRFRVDRL
jgi:hypothetical protein